MKKYILITASLILVFFACKKKETTEPELNDDGATEERAQTAAMEDRHKKLETGELKWMLDTNTLAPAAKYVVLFKSSFQPPLVEVYTGTPEGRETAASLYERDAKATIRNHFRPGLIDDNKIETWFTTLSSGFYGELTAAEVKELIRDTAVKLVELPPVYEPEGNEVKYASGTEPLFIHGYKNVTNSTKRIWILDTGGDINAPLLNVDKTLSKNFTADFMTTGSDHGTNVAHIAGAAMYSANNVRGTASGAKIVMLKVGTDDAIYWTSLNSALEYCWTYSKNGDIVNLSLSTSIIGSAYGTKAEVEKNILDFKGYDMPVVIAGGNQSRYASDRSPACLGNKYKDDPINYGFLYVVANIEATGTETEIKNRTTQFALEPSSNFGRAIRFALMGVWFIRDTDGSTSVGSGTSFSAPTLCGILYHRNTSVSMPATLTNVIKYKKGATSYTHLIPTLF